MKWVFFTLGFLPAVIVVMAMMLVASDSKIVPAARNRMRSAGDAILIVPAGTGTAAGAGGAGGGVATQNSFLWVVSARQPSETERKVLGKEFDGPQRFNLTGYRVDPWGGWSKQGHVTLMSTRDITYDLKLISLDAKGTQEYSVTRKAWDDAVEKLKDRPPPDDND